MNRFHQYMAHQLSEHLQKRRVVVWYDPNAEFEPFVTDLEDVGDGKVKIGGKEVRIAQYKGSYFGLRFDVEKYVAGCLPDPLLLYLPGVARDRTESVLMELEMAGMCYEPQLKRLARNVLRKTMDDGGIDEILAPEKVIYQDIVQILTQSEEDGGKPSNLKLLYPHAGDSIGLLLDWLSDDGRDSKIEEMQATHSLRRLIEGRLGLPLDDMESLAEARTRTLRFLFVNEFRSDLKGEPPTSLAMIPKPATADQTKRVGDLLSRLRKDRRDDYIRLADAVEKELQLSGAAVASSDLGTVDTFRFEESLLLAHCGELLVNKQYEKALVLVDERKDSFWVQYDTSRRAQWEVCRLMAELGRAVERVGPEIKACGPKVQDWVKAYCDSERGWYELDRLQRSLESWVSAMDEDPEAEEAVIALRQETEILLAKMAEGFSKALQENAWTVPGIMHQTQVYTDIVAKITEPTAFFMVDSMRYEMAVELSRCLQQVEDLSVEPAVAALPTITPVGMAALLPDASSSFSVVEHKERVAARIESQVMPGVSERMKLLKARVPGAKEITLDRLMQTNRTKLKRQIDGAPLVVVRSQEIDALCESGSELLARHVMDSIIGNLGRAVKKMATAGIQRFVLSADHGYQFSQRKKESMRMDAPGGDTVECHRRCWIGRGGKTPAGAVRVSGSELAYDTDMDFVFPLGLAVFKTGGGLAYHHGGVSLQEVVVPVVTLRVPLAESGGASITKVSITGHPKVLTNRTFGITLSVSPDMLETEPRNLRVILMANGEQVGKAGMASGDHFDRETGCVRVPSGEEVSVGILLSRNDCVSCKLVVLDASTEAVLAQTEELSIKLGM